MFDLDTFNSYVVGTVSEVVMQNVELFNQASHGTIVMVDGYNQGDVDHETFFKEIPSLVKRRDVYDDSDVAAKDLTQGDLISVKVAGGTYPINIPPSQFTWMKMHPDQGGVVFGTQFAKAMPQDQLNTGIAAAVAGLTVVGAPSGVGTLDGVYMDATNGVAAVAASNLDRLMMNDAIGYFGDKQQSIKAWVIHSAGMTKLFGDALENTNRLFSFGSVSVIQDAMGRIYFVTDSPALNNGDGTFNTLGLVEGAITIENNGDIDSNISSLNGKENIQRTIQAEWSFNVGLKGMQWASADVSPTDAAIETPANWLNVVTDIKNLPGVLIKHSINATG